MTSGFFKILFTITSSQHSFQVYFTNTYLFCLYKDPYDMSKLRPFVIPLTACWTIATHVAKCSSVRFSQRLLTHNFTIGVDGEMNFIIRTM